MQLLGMTSSTCPECLQIVPARVESDGREVRFRKFCRAHGESIATIHSDVESYLQAQRFVKPAWVPNHFAGDAKAPCPEGCGFCDRHEQHLCMPIIEITNRCNLACPICINNSGAAAPHDVTSQEFDTILDSLLRAESQVDVLNFSGGEPLLHPLFLQFADRALARPAIVRVSVSTNGLPLLATPELLEAIRARNIVVALQFDGFDDAACVALRGRPLLAEKLRLLDALTAADVTTTLTMTLADGINTSQIRPMLDCLFSRPNVASMMIQPLSLAGRAAALRGQTSRLSIPDVITLLAEAGHPAVRRGDFVPLPCSHPLCFSLAFYLMLDDGRAVSINQLADAASYMDALANRVFFGIAPDEHERLRQMIYDLWSGPAGAAPDGQAVLATLRGLLRELGARGSGFNPRLAFTSMERRVKSIFIHAFQDAGTFDLARVRRCCQACPQPDGRLVPACVRNVRGSKP